MRVQKHAGGPRIGGATEQWTRDCVHDGAVVIESVRSLGWEGDGGRWRRWRAETDPVVVNELVLYAWRCTQSTPDDFVPPLPIFSAARSLLVLLLANPGRLGLNVRKCLFVEPILDHKTEGLEVSKEFLVRNLWSLFLLSLRV